MKLHDVSVELHFFVKLIIVSCIEFVSCCC
jgi:hypothetical protein